MLVHFSEKYGILYIDNWIWKKMSTEMSFNELSDLWKRSLEIYISTLPTDEAKQEADRYFNLITKFSMEDNTFNILTSNSYAAEYLNSHFSDKIANCVVLAGGPKGCKIVFLCDPSAQQRIITPKYSEPQIPQRTSNTERENNNSPLISRLPLDPNYTFQEFVEGPSNSWAFASAKGVAAHPGERGLNPLFIHGGTGLGKTHLMQAIGNEILHSNPRLSVCYLTAEKFLNDYVNAIINNEGEKLRQRYRYFDVLLIDDIQFLQRGKQCQEEFFNTFNSLTTQHKQIVMTSDVSPKNLSELDARLISRFMGGMVQEIEAPGYETRLAILKKKAENKQPRVPDKVLEFLASKINSHVRAIEGALSKVCVIMQMNPSIVFTSESLSVLLKDFIEKEQNIKRLTVREIQESVAKKFGITLAQMVSKDRSATYVTPRQLAMYISRKYSSNTLIEISNEFNKKHATVVYNVKTMTKRLETEPALKATLEEILAEFGCKSEEN